MADLDTPKYAVLKWEDWSQWRDEWLQIVGKIQEVNPDALVGVLDLMDIDPDVLLVNDAEVIRKQDITSGPVFHLYANLIHAYRDLLNDLVHPESGLLDPLSGIADHFHEAGLDADLIRATGQAKLPD